ncbi:MAG: hypothetical protein ACREAA_11250 [Candidatus Polarisedimenticolia bacterium]
MRKLLCSVLVLVMAAVAGAGLLAQGKTHDVTAQVVSVDAAAKTITIKGDDGKDKTVPVSGNALKSLATVKAGDKVVLTCTDNDKGEHQAVTEIKPSKA